MPAPAGTVLTYQRLTRRNQRVGLLRMLVPLAGALVLGALIGQIYLASQGSRFGIGQLTITPEAVAIDAPEYVGTLADGSSYRVWAETARATIERSDLIDLFNATLVIDRKDGVQLTLYADEGQLDTTAQLTLVPGRADFSDTTGTVGTLENSVFDWQSQILTARGPVTIDYADGSSIRAGGLIYDAATVVWTFERSVVSLPSTPGEQSDASTGEQTE